MPIEPESPALTPNDALLNAIFDSPEIQEREAAKAAAKAEREALVAQRADVAARLHAIHRTKVRDGRAWEYKIRRGMTPPVVDCASCREPVPFWLVDDDQNCENCLVARRNALATTPNAR